MRPEKKEIAAYFREYACRQPEKRLFFDENRTYTAAGAYGECCALAEKLRSLGLGPGRSLALRTVRSVDGALMLLASLMTGALVAMTDPHKSARQFISDVGTPFEPDFVLTNEAAGLSLSSNGGWVLAGPAGQEPIAVEGPGARTGPEPEKTDPMAPALIIFTSGSTGSAKAVTLSQYNFMNHIRNFSASGCYLPSDVSMEVLPINHVFGLAVIMMGIYMGYPVLFPPSTDPETVAPLMERHGVTRLDGVPSYALAISRAKEKLGLDLSSLRVGVVGGAPLSSEQFGYIEAALGLKLLPVYGMSECVGITGAGETEDREKRRLTVGRPLPMTELHILGPDGREAPEGEICVRCPAVMLGYYGEEAATAAALEGGLLHTGDLGRLDEAGFLVLTGRKKDIIIRNGNNISAVRIEQTLEAAPGVLEAAVAGLSSPTAGEEPWALVRGEGVTKAGLLEFLKTRLDKNELPAGIVLTDRLPRTASGKKDKAAVRRMLEASRG